MELVKHRISDFKPKSYSISTNFEMTSNLKYFETNVIKDIFRPTAHAAAFAAAVTGGGDDEH